MGGINVTLVDTVDWKKIAGLLSDLNQIREYAQAWLDSRSSQPALDESDSIAEELTALENEQRRYLDAYGKGLIPENMFEEKMKETTRRKEQLTSSLSATSKNRDNAVKIDINQLVEKAVQKIESLAFEQKNFIVERVVHKIIASPQEITIWGHIPVPATVSEKVNYGSQYRHRRPP